MGAIERRIVQEAKAMTREEVLVKAIEKRITWLQAADILGMTPRHVRRIRVKVEEFGLSVLKDKRAGSGRRKRVPAATIEALCRLKREQYADFSVRHFHEFATEKPGLKLSYTLAKTVLQAAGLAERATRRGTYRRKRERRPMRGMLLHLDASTHRWLPELPMQDLMVMLDDADGRILYARFVAQEGTAATFAVLYSVLIRQGRFSELYTDRGSHFCNTTVAERGPDEHQNGQVPRALRALGIRQILARSPEARGRSERAFGTIQGRLPQELRLAEITTYEGANVYLEKVFVPDFNRRFTVKPAQRENAFVPIAGIDLRLLLSIQHDRVVRADSTVTFERLSLQLPKTKDRRHFVRCPVLVHELVDGSLAVSHQARLLARFTRQGDLISPSHPRQRVAA
jgi:hypothetical protein